MKKNFKDFWTHDLKKFYDESWGHENYNHVEVQSSMPGGQDKWKVIPTDRFRITDKSRGPFCIKCKERGHFQYECPKLRNPKCYICGYSGHFYYKCPNAVCTTCRSAAIYHTVRCYDCHRVKNLKCNLCKTMGHTSNHCPDMWRRYHLTTEHSKRLKKSNSKPKERNKLWCPNCAKRGHSADKCSYPRQDRILSSTEIFSYEATYDVELEQSRDISATISANKKDTEKNDVIEILSDSNNKNSSSKNKKNDFVVELSSDSSDNESSNDKKEKNDSELTQSSNAKKSRKKNKTIVTKTKLKKYQNILYKMKKKCKTSDKDSLERITQYLKAIKNKTFTKINVQELMKFRIKFRKQLKMLNR